MASYHLSVKTVKRSAGRTATASAAYRAGERLHCAREGRDHDYTRKQGIEDTFIVTPPDAPDWACERTALWNAAEAREVRRNAVTAREWELALPSELSADARAQIARDFAQALVDRYGVTADVAVHAPHREGDQRNHHAHILTTTRVMGAEGLGDKTRILDAAKTGGGEIAAMREVWAHMQNRALEREGQGVRVDHRSLEDQRAAALARGEELMALELDRTPEIKLGPAANAMERRASALAERTGASYVPVTERGAQNHAIRERRDLLGDLRNRVEVAREAYVQARALDASRLSAAIDAARAMFASPETDAFAAGFSATWQKDENARQQALAEQEARLRAAAQERERQAQLTAQREEFIEKAAQFWEASRQAPNLEEVKDLKHKMVEQIHNIAERHGLSFADFADPINARANELRDSRLAQEREIERQKELELERINAREAGYSHGL